MRRDTDRRVPTVEGEALALINALILVDKEVEVIIRVLDRANLILIIDKVSESSQQVIQPLVMRDK